MKNLKSSLFLASMFWLSFGVLLLLGLAARNGILDPAASSSAIEDLENYRVIDARSGKEVALKKVEGSDQVIVEELKRESILED